jgi:hypothetical protein
LEDLSGGVVEAVNTDAGRVEEDEQLLRERRPLQWRPLQWRPLQWLATAVAGHEGGWRLGGWQPGRFADEPREQ